MPLGIDLRVDCPGLLFGGWGPPQRGPGLRGARRFGVASFSAWRRRSRAVGGVAAESDGSCVRPLPLRGVHGAVRELDQVGEGLRVLRVGGPFRKADVAELSHARSRGELFRISAGQGVALIEALQGCHDLWAELRAGVRDDLPQRGVQ